MTTLVYILVMIYGVLTIFLTFYSAVTVTFGAINFLLMILFIPMYLAWVYLDIKNKTH